MGYKSRDNFLVEACLKKCSNRDRKAVVEGRSYDYCGECVASRNYRPLTIEGFSLGK
jgi:hypothetical protein